jgi:hypothetical protein
MRIPAPTTNKTSSNISKFYPSVPVLLLYIDVERIVAYKIGPGNRLVKKLLRKSSRLIPEGSRKWLVERIN